MGTPNGIIMQFRPRYNKIHNNILQKVIEIISKDKLNELNSMNFQPKIKGLN